ncbi:MAG: integrase core domain-containing protein [Thalassovita sp.]
MRKRRFNEAQTIGMIKEKDAGMPAAEVCRQHGLIRGTFYKFKSKYSGMEPSDAKRLRAHENENGKLRDECLHETLFGTLGHVRKLLEEWQEGYNGRRPHSALRNLTPMDKMAA